MTPPLYPCNRTRWLAFGILSLWLVLAGRLIQLQWFSRVEFGDQAAKQKLTIETIPARPGEIVDRDGHVLAMTISCSSLFLNPSRIDNPQDVATRVCLALDLDADQIEQRIVDNKQNYFIWVKRRLTDAETAAVRKLELADEIWGFRDEYLRRFPQGVVAAHILGTRDIDGVGHGGLEQTLNDTIQGTDGSRALVRDARGVVIEVDQGLTRPPEHGQSTSLTIDTVIQLHTERELDRLVEKWKPAGASAIVMDPHSGEILAMASRPVFDPNHPVTEDSRAWTNLNVAAVFEPGSTFKPFVVATAMERGLLNHDDTFFCENGRYKMGRRVLHDHHPYGRLSLTDVLVKSSNIGMAKIAERMGLATLYDCTTVWGFGRRTGIELPGEVSGLIRPLQKWDDYSLGSIPMGQELAVTPLQLITAHAALANGGQLVNPHLILDQTLAAPQPDSEVSSAAPPSRVVSRTASEDIVRWLIRGPMTAVVNRGTAREGRIAGINVFGKTGTAQKIDPQTGTYSKTEHVCSYVCGAPSEDPQVVILVVVDGPTIGGPHYGGSVAAPAARRILERTLVAESKQRTRTASQLR
jgi:cell division protein FtsI (penicillin-binding protein 3)